MAFRPNFTGVSRNDDTVILSGESNPEPPDDILDIRVSLRQGERIEHAAVGQVGGANWNVRLPAAGFVAGPAVAFGVEMRRENATTVTWTQSVNLPET